jgi:hypothetical protein
MSKLVSDEVDRLRPSAPDTAPSRPPTGSGRLPEVETPLAVSRPSPEPSPDDEAEPSPSPRQAPGRGAGILGHGVDTTAGVTVVAPHLPSGPRVALPRRLAAVGAVLLVSAGLGLVALSALRGGSDRIRSTPGPGGERVETVGSERAPTVLGPDGLLPDRDADQAGAGARPGASAVLEVDGDSGARATPGSTAAPTSRPGPSAAATDAASTASSSSTGGASSTTGTAGATAGPTSSNGATSTTEATTASARRNDNRGGTAPGRGRTTTTASSAATPATATTIPATSTASTTATGSTSAVGNGAIGPPPAGTVIWEDRFDTFDTTVWRVEHSTYGDGNGELQCYRPDNVAVSGGNLVLAARTETVVCPNGQTRRVSSGMVRSRGVSFTPGQAIEFRVKLTPADHDDQGGLWPAVWASSWAGSWPSGGELDWLEVMTAEDPTRAMFSLHHADPTGAHRLQNRGVAGPRDFSAAWHTVRFDYGHGGRLRWYLDGALAFSVDGADTLQGYPAPFDQTIGEIKVNLALGGSPGPLAPGALGATGATFAVDYIRIIQL